MSGKKKSPVKKVSFFNRIVLFFNLVFIIMLFLAYLSRHINPGQLWIMPFFGLGFPYLVIINLFFIIYWLFNRSYFFLFSGLAFVIGWSQMQRFVQFSGISAPPESINTFKLTSYNVMNMAHNNLFIDDSVVRNQILLYLQHDKPDVLCLQEFASKSKNPSAYIDTLAELLGMPWHEHAQYSEKNSRAIDAVITFSRFPIIKSEIFERDDKHNYALYSDIITGIDTIRIYNVHLESYRLRHEDYEFISDIDNKVREEGKFKEGSRRIISKMRTAFTKRALQVAELKSSASESPYPVIICGDFNDTPCSFTYHELAKNYKDAFIESGSGFGFTYAGKLPSYRIDYILHDDRLSSWAYKTTRNKLSDHYPISCLIGHEVK